MHFTITIVLWFYTEHSSIIPALCVKFQNDLSAAKYVMGRQVMSIFEFKISFGGPSEIATVPNVQTMENKADTYLPQVLLAFQIFAGLSLKHSSTNLQVHGMVYGICKGQSLIMPLERERPHRGTGKYMAKLAQKYVWKFTNVMLFVTFSNDVFNFIRVPIWEPKLWVPRTR